MKASRIHKSGNADVLKYEDVDTPRPKENEVLVKIEAAGINFIDIYLRKGLYSSPLPAIFGMEAGGVVAELGKNVKEFKKGDRVAYTGVMGSYAEYNAVPAERLVKLPDEISAKQGAALMLQGMTAHYLSHDAYPLKKNDTALIHAAAGGVGLLLVQMAKLRGAKVIGTVSTEEKAKLAKETGADEVIIYMSELQSNSDHPQKSFGFLGHQKRQGVSKCAQNALRSDTKKDFEEETQRITNNEGVNVVYDSVGKATFEKGLRLLKRKGYMILYGQSSGSVPPIDLSLGIKNSIFITRPSLMDYTATRDELLQRANDVFSMVISGKLKLNIFKEFALKDAAEAHKLLEERKTTGKLLLVP